MERDGWFVNPLCCVVVLTDAFIVVPFTLCDFSYLPLQANVSAKRGEWRTEKITKHKNKSSASWRRSHKEPKVLPSVPASHTHKHIRAGTQTASEKERGR